VFGYSTSPFIVISLVCTRIVMALVEKTVIIPFSAAQMFALVDNVTDYSQFLPWCGGGSVQPLTGNTVLATVNISYMGIKQSFTTENTREIPQHIGMKLRDGPFKILEGDWHFIALTPDACKIQFKLHYEFSNKLLEKLLGPVFHLITNSFVEAFIERAEKVYATHK